MTKTPRIETTFRKPLLAEDIEDVNTLRYPLMVAMKKDGFRGISKDGQGLTRNFKPIANRFTREWIEKNIPSGMEGELTIVDGDFNSCQSAFTTRDGEPNFIFNAFDWFNPSMQYKDRYAALIQWQKEHSDLKRFAVISHKFIYTPQELIDFEEACSKISGLDGIITRDPFGYYKCGRATLKDQLLLRIKRWADSEAKIIEVYEQMSNQNEATTGALGQTERSTHKENMVPAGTFGGFIVQDLKTGQIFKCGGGEGLDHATRQEWWNKRDELPGKFITYKFMKAGMKKDGLPRFPQVKEPEMLLKGIRSADDFGGD